MRAAWKRLQVKEDKLRIEVSWGIDSRANKKRLIGLVNKIQSGQQIINSTTLLSKKKLSFGNMEVNDILQNHPRS